ncbi:MAG: Hsp70 family protein [Myxococcota bacterium]
MWAFDLGTTNTGVARWDAEARRPSLLTLPGICRTPGGALEAPPVVPSATHVLEADLAARVGAWPWVRHHTFLGTQALIGRPALERNAAWPGPAFAVGWKTALAREPTRPLVRVGDRSFTARDVARRFVRELLVAVKAESGERVRDLVLTVPVGSWEAYRAELGSLATDLGVTRLRFLDEPVAAAIGYGLGIDRERRVLVFDMGGGTLHVALVRLSARGTDRGMCEVLAKHGRAVGGDLVDRWLLEDVCAALGIPLAPERATETADETEGLWWRLMLAEARRVKEAVHIAEQATFTVIVPDELRGLRARLRDCPTSLVVTRTRVEEVLRTRGLYTLVDEAVDATLAEAGVAPDEVLLVGGSSLLPGIYPRLEQRFGRDRVRAWLPFEAVVLGGAVYAGEAWAQSDFIVHDYALVTHDRDTQAPAYTIVVPRGTRFPTAPDLWKRQLVPTCALGEPESLFKLVVYEIGGHGGDARRFGWDAAGALHVLHDGDRVVVPLNEANPTLGTLDPPHAPSDKRPRLELAFGVNANRWLCATVTDLQSKKKLLKDEPVVRLL